MPGHHVPSGHHRSEHLVGEATRPANPAAFPYFLSLDTTETLAPMSHFIGAGEAFYTPVTAGELLRRGSVSDSVGIPRM